MPETLPPTLHRILPLLNAGFRPSGYKSWRAREGDGFQYTLLHNGNRVALVSNDGDGGAGRLEWFGLRHDGSPMTAYKGETPANAKKRVAAATVAEPAFKEFQTILDATPPNPEFPDLSEEEAANWLLSDLTYFLDLAKQCKKETLFLLPSDTDTETFHCIRLPFDGRVKAHISMKYPGATIMNEVVQRYAA